MPETLKVNEQKLLKLLREWHFDTEGYLSNKQAHNKARNYARRFLTRLKREALEK